MRFMSCESSLRRHLQRLPVMGFYFVFGFIAVVGWKHPRPAWMVLLPLKEEKQAIGFRV